MNDFIARTAAEMANAHDQAIERVLQHLVATGVPLDEMSIQRDSGNGITYVAHKPPNAMEAIRVAQISGEFQTGDDGSMIYMVIASPVLEGGMLDE